MGMGMGARFQSGIMGFWDLEGNRFGQGPVVGWLWWAWPG